MITLPCAAQPVFYLRSILHGAVFPPPPYNSCSSTSTTAPRLSPAVVVLRLCRCLFVDCRLFVVVVSTVVAPPPPTVRRVSSAAVVLQTVDPPTQPLRPASPQPLSLSAFASAHLLIVVFCHCCRHRCSPSTADRPQPPSSSTSSAVVLHLILPSSLFCRCACCALVDCCLLLVAAPLLPLRHHSCCLSVVIICHVICRGAASCTKTNMQVR
jgi:hypothetical protein